MKLLNLFFCVVTVTLSTSLAQQEPANLLRHTSAAARTAEIDNGNVIVSPDSYHDDRQDDRGLLFFCIPDGFFCLIGSVLCCSNRCGGLLCESPPTNSPTAPPTFPPTAPPTSSPTTDAPTSSPTTASPTTFSPTTDSPTTAPPTESPTTAPPTESPTTAPPTSSPTTASPTSSPTTDSPTTSAPTPTPDLLQAIEKRSDLSSFAFYVRAVSTVDPEVINRLTNVGFSTMVFVPTNSAFTAILQTNPGLTSNTALLAQVLRYHLVPDNLLTMTQLQNLPNKSPLTTVLAGQNITVEVSGGGQVILTHSNGVALVTDFDTVTSNGIFHVVNTVLVPGSVTLPDEFYGLPDGSFDWEAYP